MPLSHRISPVPPSERATPWPKSAPATWLPGSRGKSFPPGSTRKWKGSGERQDHSPADLIAARWRRGRRGADALPVRLQFLSVLNHLVTVGHLLRHKGILEAAHIADGPRDQVFTDKVERRHLVPLRRD